MLNQKQLIGVGAAVVAFSIGIGGWLYRSQANDKAFAHEFAEGLKTEGTLPIQMDGQTLIKQEVNGGQLLQVYEVPIGVSPDSNVTADQIRRRCAIIQPAIGKGLELIDVYQLPDGKEVWRIVVNKKTCAENT